MHSPLQQQPHDGSMPALTRVAEQPLPPQGAQQRPAIVVAVTAEIEKQLGRVALPVAQRRHRRTRGRTRMVGALLKQRHELLAISAARGCRVELLRVSLALGSLGSEALRTVMRRTVASRGWFGAGSGARQPQAAVVREVARRTRARAHAPAGTPH